MRGVYEKVKGSNDWYISYFDADGKHHRQHVGRYTAAVEAYVNKKREIREGKFIAPAAKKDNRLTLEELFNRRRDAMQGQLSASTRSLYKTLFATSRFNNLRNVPVRKIRAKDIENFLNALYEQRLGAASITAYRSLLCAVFSYGVSIDEVDANPVLKTRPPKQKSRRTRFLSRDEEVAMREKLRESCPKHEAELDVLLNTGMRIGELWHLTWDRVHPDRGVIEVPDEGKTGWRNIPMNAACQNAIATLHKQSGGSNFCVPSRQAKRSRRYPANWVREAAAAAGVLNITPHTLRHTFATRLVMAGVDLRTVQQFLGHAAIEMTMRYAQFSPEHGRLAIEKLAPAAAQVEESAVKKPPVRARAAAHSAPAKRPPSRVRVETPDVVKIA